MGCSHCVHDYGKTISHCDPLRIGACVQSHTLACFVACFVKLLFGLGFCLAFSRRLRLGSNAWVLLLRGTGNFQKGGPAIS